MKRHSRSGITSFAAVALLALVLFGTGTAHAVTVTGPKTTNSGSNDVTIGAGLWFGSYYLAKCEDGAFSWLTTSTGATVNLGGSPNLNDWVIFNIFQNGNDYVRKVNSGGMWCAGIFMAQLQSNGHEMLMYMMGGDDNVSNFNMGGSLSLVGFGGNDTLLPNTASGTNNAQGDDGNDQVGTYGTGNDYISGGNGNDFLTWAGGGSNTCDGGAGTDKCVNTTCTTKISCETIVAP